MSEPIKSIRVLGADLIDYAGLFPPAGLSMTDAVANYAGYLTSEDSWALARFVVPVSRLEEFETCQMNVITTEPWRLSALVGTAAESDLASARDFNQRNQGRACIDAVEIRALSADHVRAVHSHVPKGITAYYEIAPDAIEQLLPVLREIGARAKIRTGGVTADLFPSPDSLATFIVSCASAGVPFKATAGLHHPIRCVKALTYEPGSATGTMHGFLNVFLAAAFALHGTHAGDLVDLLEDRSAENFVFTNDGVRWHGYSLGTDQLQATRRRFAVSFGSCSFEEPLADLRTLKLL